MRYLVRKTRVYVFNVNTAEKPTTGIANNINTAETPTTGIGNNINTAEKPTTGVGTKNWLALKIGVSRSAGRQTVQMITKQLSVMVMMTTVDTVVTLVSQSSDNCQHRQTDKQTERKRDRQTDRETERKRELCQLSNQRVQQTCL